MVKKRTRVVVKKKKLGDYQSLDSSLLVAGTAAGAGIGGARARRGIATYVPVTKTDRIRMARQGIQNVATYRQDLKAFADAKRGAAEGNRYMKEADSAATALRKDSRFLTGKAGSKQKAIDNMTKGAEETKAFAKRDMELYGNRMARNRANVGAQIETAVRSTNAARRKAAVAKRSAATRRGATRGAISGFALTSLALLVAKELRKKKD